MSVGVSNTPRPGRWKRRILIGVSAVVLLCVVLIVIGLTVKPAPPSKPKPKASAAGLVHLRYGQKATLSPEWTQDGIVSATVYPLQLNFKSQTPSTPDAGMRFAVAAAQICAGAHGANTESAFLPLPFALLYPHNQTYGVLDAPDAAREPDVHNLSGKLRPKQCVRGYLTFQYARKTKPLAVDWGGPNQPSYVWVSR